MEARRSKQKQQWGAVERSGLNAGMTRLLTREVPTAAKLRAMLRGVEPSRTPLVTPLTAAPSGAVRAARVVALSRVKTGRQVVLSQLVGDVALRIALRGEGEDCCAPVIALEILLSGRRWRLEVGRDQLAHASLSATDAPDSDEAERRLECGGCGRRFGCEAHFRAHSALPCAPSGGKRARSSSSSNASSSEDAEEDEERPRVRLQTARIEFKADAVLEWSYEREMSPDALTASSWCGASATWARAQAQEDPFCGELQRVKVLTARLRDGADAVELDAELVRATKPAPKTTLPRAHEPTKPEQPDPP